MASPLNPWAWLILIPLVLAIAAAAWMGVGRNRGSVTQQHVRPRR